MANYSFGDVLIITFPFSDGLTSKRRPAMVIKDTNDGDILIAKVTSKPYSTRYDCIIKEWAFANLINVSTVRVHKIQTIHSNLVFGKVGTLHTSDKKVARRALAELIVGL